MEITGWKAFEHLPDFKKTLILPDNVAIRVQKKHGVLYFCHFKMTPDKTKDNYGHLYWILLFVHFDRNHMAEHFQSADGKRIAPFLFALLCFLLLTDKNEEILLGPGQKYGTIKTGKTINIFPTPITIVNSKWNTIIRRTDGFPVSGHFRLQPYNHGSYYQLIFIEPFMKTGYTRRSGKELEDEKNL